jgi:hypothetical protein
LPSSSKYNKKILIFVILNFLIQECGTVDGNGAVCDQKFSRFLVSHVEESMAGHVSVLEFISSLGGELQKGAWWDQVEAGSRESFSLFQVL